ncbi:DUF4263 domain-containing protein [Alteromonadaceae bacterium M269]|nr:DUF4263 domain-containing protein [Alteromonadaceae bacterium M269]
MDLRILPQRPEGTLSISDVSNECVEVHFIPPQDSFRYLKKNIEQWLESPPLLMKFDASTDYIEIHPINTLETHKDFLCKKYDVLEKIVVEHRGLELPQSTEELLEILEQLPTGFIRNFNYGLGLIKELLPLINTLEKLEVNTLCISESSSTPAYILEELRLCQISISQFDRIRKELAKVANRARATSLKYRRIVAHNTLSGFLDDEYYPPTLIDIKNNELDKLIAKDLDNAHVSLSKSEQSKAMSLVKNNAREIAKQNPTQLSKLRNDIELVSLEELINNFERMLSKNLNENVWQKLFNENQFILSMAFGYPVIIIEDQASVGGRKLSGSGEKISDFIARNTKTNNTAIVEIKKPSTKLVGKTEYRPGVYAPSSELSASITQTLDQKYNLQKDINSIKVNSRIFEIETYSVHCALIIGKVPSNEDQKKSFELFRRNSKDVEIITFDEMLEKLKHLHSLLSEN